MGKKVYDVRIRQLGSERIVSLHQPARRGWGRRVATLKVNKGERLADVVEKLYDALETATAEEMGA